MGSCCGCNGNKQERTASNKRKTKYNDQHLVNGYIRDIQSNLLPAIIPTAIIALCQEYYNRVVLLYLMNNVDINPAIPHTHTTMNYIHLQQKSVFYFHRNIFLQNFLLSSYVL